MARRTPTKAVPISEARRRLFELVDDVMTGRASRVALSHRAHDDEVVLVRARELAKLEREVADLRARVEPEPRPLRGMMRLSGTPEEFDEWFASNRAHQAALFEAKLAAIHAAPDADEDAPAENAPDQDAHA